MTKNILLLLLPYTLLLSLNPLVGRSLKITEENSSILSYELNRNEQGDYVVSLLSDTTWTFPDNVVSTAQVTVRVPTGGFEVENLKNLIDGVVFMTTSRDNHPEEAPQFDYISFNLLSQGTTNIPFERGRKVDLFSFTNVGICPDGVVTLMDNIMDPFMPPNSRQSNVGQQITVSGFLSAGLMVGISGEGVPCNTDASPPLSDLTLQIAVQPISCVGMNDGTIVLKAENGERPYTYSWNNGATTSSLDNLSAGTYMVTVEDNNGFRIERTITIEDATALELFLSKTNVSMAGANDGGGRAIVLGGAPPYTYLWSNGATSKEVSNLVEGDYTLVVTDAHGCTASQNITIIDQSTCPTINIVLDRKSPTCIGDGDGEITVTPTSGTAPYTYVWEHGHGANFANNLSAGNYMVTITDNDGCTMAASVMLPDATPININLDTGIDQIESMIEGGAVPYTYAWSNGVTSPSINNLTSGLYMLTVTDNNGCTQVASGVIQAVGCNLGILNDLGASVTLDTVPCDEKGTLCLPIPLDSIRTNYSIFLDGDSYSSNLEGCKFQSFFAYSYAFFSEGNTPGNYELREWNVDGVTYSGTFNTIDALVDSMNLWDADGNWANLKNISIIRGGDVSRTYGTMVLISNSGSTTIEINSNFTPTGTFISLKPGNHEVVLVNNASTCSDTLLVNLPCEDRTIPTQDTVITVMLNEGEQNILCLPPVFGENIRVSENTCPASSGTSATITLNNASHCIDIEGLLMGTDEACYTVTNEEGITINLTVVVQVMIQTMPCFEPSQDTVRSFSSSCNAIQACLDIPLDLITNATILVNGVRYTGQIEACDSEGSLLSFAEIGVYSLRVIYNDSCLIDMTVIVACDSDEVIEQNIELGELDVLCLTIPGIFGVFETVENICPEKSGTNVVFTVLEDSGCINYNGIGIGSDTACIRACDIFGFCDTISLIFNVADSTATPPPLLEAIDDTTSIQLNSSIVLNVLSNDLFRELDTIFLVTEPNFGIVSLNLDRTINYIAQTGYCNEEEPDTFLYGICENGFCDTAMVSIRVHCFMNRELVIYTGISPNGDGVNDSFLVEGIEGYPNNSVSVFNRWGNMVFQQNGYKNEWQATWQNDKQLPDGTYFYVLDLGDGSKPMKGYLHVRR